MKTPRYLGLLLGALIGATGLFAQATPAALPPPPTGYDIVSTMQMKNTMKGRKDIITWTCFADFAGGAKPAKRTTAWLVGSITGQGAAGLDLWDIGAQHRIAVIKLRPSAPGNQAVTIEQQTDANGAALPAGTKPKVDAKGFYTIEPNGANPGVNQYVIKTSAPNVVLEVYYAAHPPPGYPLVTPPATSGARQAEDGGPPSIPPVNEN